MFSSPIDQTKNKNKKQKKTSNQSTCSFTLVGEKTNKTKQNLKKYQHFLFKANIFSLKIKYKLERKLARAKGKNLKLHSLL
jgi:hypothetical protein